MDEERKGRGRRKDIVPSSLFDPALASKRQKTAYAATLAAADNTSRIQNLPLRAVPPPVEQQFPPPQIIDDSPPDEALASQKAVNLAADSAYHKFLLDNRKRIANEIAKHSALEIAPGFCGFIGELEGSYFKCNAQVDVICKQCEGFFSLDPLTLQHDSAYHVPSTGTLYIISPTFLFDSTLLLSS
jgi:hypothetical protein